MLEYLKTAMWFNLSCKLKLSLQETKETMRILKKKYDDNPNYILEDASTPVQEAFDYYLTSITKLGND